MGPNVVCRVLTPQLETGRLYFSKLIWVEHTISLGVHVIPCIFFFGVDFLSLKFPISL